MTTFTALFDACVLYPAPLRDFLLHLSCTGLFRARWTEEIHVEWTRNLLANRTDLRPEQLQRTRDLMNKAVPDCLVTGHMKLVDSLTRLPTMTNRQIKDVAPADNAIIILYPQ